LCALYGYEGRDLSIFQNGRVGAGFFPLLVGACCAVQAAVFVFRPQDEKVAPVTAAEIYSIGRMLGIILGSLLIMAYAGFVIGTIVMLACFWISRPAAGHIAKTAVAVGAVATASYYLFGVLLNIPLPSF
jgi:hypothetical protein